ncbi:DUF748 domain-containing protein [Thalassotalea ponticola]|uniref:DUF748 domain-containing protein n=1 Tax=Thalassotalea ponticola TaxID=1523392 RepID=UPI0025B33A7B|nr:DUF748 domain-containing protein [Thalassotalea ponticola]MDN3652959.1 DUF748 domain-containing protein [Thalassotalea ponticola]
MNIWLKLLIAVAVLAGLWGALWLSSDSIIKYLANRYLSHLNATLSYQTLRFSPTGLSVEVDELVVHYQDQVLLETDHLAANLEIQSLFSNTIHLNYLNVDGFVLNHQQLKPLIEQLTRQPSAPKDNEPTPTSSQSYTIDEIGVNGRFVFSPDHAPLMVHAIEGADVELSEQGYKAEFNINTSYLDNALVAGGDIDGTLADLLIDITSVDSRVIASDVNAILSEPLPLTQGQLSLVGQAKIRYQPEQINITSKDASLVLQNGQLTNIASDQAGAKIVLGVAKLQTENTNIDITQGQLNVQTQLAQLQADKAQVKSLRVAEQKSVNASSKALALTTTDMRVQHSDGALTFFTGSSEWSLVSPKLRFRDVRANKTDHFELQQLQLKTRQTNVSLASNSQLNITSDASATVEKFIWSNSQEKQKTQLLMINNAELTANAIAHSPAQQLAIDSLAGVADIVFAKDKDPLQVKQLTLTNIALNKDSYQAQLDANLVYRQNTAALAAHAKGKGKFVELGADNVDARVDVEDINDFLTNALPLSQGVFTVNGQAKLVYDDQGIVVTSEKSEVSLTEGTIDNILNKEDSFSKIDIETVRAGLSDFNLSFDQNNAFRQFSSRFDGATQSLHWLQTDKQGEPIAKILSLEGAQIVALTLAQQNKKPMVVTLDNITLTNGLFSHVNKMNTLSGIESSAIKPLLEFNQLKLAKLSWKDRDLQVDNIDIDVKHVELYRDEQSKIANLVNIFASENAQPKQGKAATSEAKTTSGQTEDFSMHVNQVQLSGKPEFFIHDYSLTEVFEQRVVIEQLTVTDIDKTTDGSRKMRTKFAGQGRLGKRSLISIEGSLFPFAERLDTQAKGRLDGIDLKKFTPYLIDSSGLSIERGLLYADFHFAVAKGLIDGEVKTRINGLRIKEQKSSNASASGLPLSTVVAQLTDEQGNMKVTVPLTGNVDDPNFGLGGFISLITTKAIKEGAQMYLLQTLVPYAGVANIVMMASGDLFKIKIEDLPYQIGQTELTDEQQPFVDKLAKLLNQRKKLHLTICPVVIGNTDDKTVAHELRKMGQKRTELFIDELIDKHNIKSTRLIPCRTKIKAKSKPKLTFKAN